MLSLEDTNRVIFKENNSFHRIDPIFIFKTKHFCENLHEYFFVRNQFLFIKMEKNNTNIIY